MRALASVVVAFAVLASGAGAMPGYSAWSAPVNLGAPVNTAANETGPALSKDGLSLYFTSTRAGGSGGQDIWVAQRASVDGPWGAPVNLGPTVNTAAIDRNPILSRDGHELFFASTRSGFGNSDNWLAYREDTKDELGWQSPVNLGPTVNSADQEGGPAYFENDDEGVPLLFFVSVRASGRGGADIYISARGADGVFGAPALVDELSTAFGEARPAIRRDGREILFHSFRPGSMLDPCPYVVTGETPPGVDCFDLWGSSRDTTSDAWSPPVNLGPEINSIYGDIDATLSSDGRTLIFASNRPGGIGGFDLYVATRTKVQP
jgi:Tol biopolymer transport system component